MAISILACKPSDQNVIPHNSSSADAQFIVGENGIQVLLFDPTLKHGSGATLLLYPEGVFSSGKQDFFEAEDLAILKAYDGDELLVAIVEPKATTTKTLFTSIEQLRQALGDRRAKPLKIFLGNGFP